MTDDRGAPGNGPVGDPPGGPGEDPRPGDGAVPPGAVPPAGADAPRAAVDRAGEAVETMMRQLTDLLGQWERQALDLAERGVDPRPLLAELSRSLRMVADQLDDAARGGGR